MAVFHIGPPDDSVGEVALGAIDFSVISRSGGGGFSGGSGTYRSITILHLTYVDVDVDNFTSANKLFIGLVNKIKGELSEYFVL